MNVDGTGEIGCPVVIEPPVIAEPAIRGRQHDEFTRARMVEAERPFAFLPMHGGNAVEPFEELLHLCSVGSVLEIDMRDLVVCDGECLGCSRIQQLAAHLVAHAD